MLKSCRHQARHSDLVDANKHLGRRVQKLIKEEQEKLVALEEKGKHSSQVKHLQSNKINFFAGAE